MIASTMRCIRRFRGSGLAVTRGRFPQEFVQRDSPVAVAVVGRPPHMKKTLVMVGSVAGSSLFGWLGGSFGLMTGFMLGMLGTGLGMYAGARLAAHLGA